MLNLRSKHRQCFKGRKLHNKTSPDAMWSAVQDDLRRTHAITDCLGGRVGAGCVATWEAGAASSPVGLPAAAREAG